jgi:hypothetical protein
LKASFARADDHAFGWKASSQVGLVACTFHRLSSMPALHRHASKRCGRGGENGDSFMRLKDDFHSADGRGETSR